MTRTTQSSDDGRERFERIAENILGQQRRAAASGGGPSGPELTRTELLSGVCKYLCAGKTMAEIQAHMTKRYGVTLKREDPYVLVRYAGSKGWLHFDPPEEVALSLALKARYAGLKKAVVVNTVVADHVACHSAKQIVKLLKKRAAPPYSQREVHIGLSGGAAIWKLARALARRLRKPWPGMPETVVIHALVAGIDAADPKTDPNAFFAHFTNNPLLHVKVRFVSLRAPHIVVETEQYEELKQQRGIKEAFDAARDLDIIVTSASEWGDPHNMLRSYMAQCPTSLSILEGANPECDLLWRPINADGPIEVKTPIRTMTLLELADLPGFIKEGKDVVLVLGPCGGCDRPKGHALNVILGQRVPLVTHVVTDTRSAREALNGHGGPEGNGNGDGKDEGGDDEKGGGNRKGNGKTR